MARAPGSRIPEALVRIQPLRRNQLTCPLSRKRPGGRGPNEIGYRISQVRVLPGGAQSTARTAAQAVSNNPASYPCPRPTQGPQTATK